MGVAPVIIPKLDHFSIDTSGFGNPQMGIILGNPFFLAPNVFTARV